MLPLAAAGYHVMAPDQRGYGRSGGTEVRFDDDLAPFSTFNRVRDMLALTAALGHRSLAGVVGHDFGSPVAGWCALTRPDVFQRRGDDERAVCRHRAAAVQYGERAGRAAVAGLRHGRRARPALAAAQALPDLLHDPRGQPEHVAGRRRGCTRSCAPTTTPRAPTGRRTRRIRWPPTPPRSSRKLPRYYVMDKDKGMAEQVAADMPTAARDRRLPLAARPRAGDLRRRVRPQRLPGRAAVVPCRPRRHGCRPSCRCSPAAPSTCRRRSSPARATGASSSAPAASTRCRRRRARSSGARIWSRAPGTGCSRSSPRRRRRSSCSS